MAEKNGQIVPRNVQGFPAIPSEEVLLRRRQHPLALFFPMVAVILLSLLSFVILVSASVFVPAQAALFAVAGLVILVLTLSELTKVAVDWYFHFYILTNHRVLEISYRPFFSDKINNVILNQVKSTEIDIESNGIINRIFDMGHVTVTFDRPTHQEEFIFANIKNPKSVGFLLCDALDTTKPNVNVGESAGGWFRSMKKMKEEEEEEEKTGGRRRFRFTEDLFPSESFGTV